MEKNTRRPQLATTTTTQTLEQLAWIKKNTGMTKATAITIAVRNLYNAEQRKKAEEGEK